MQEIVYRKLEFYFQSNFEKNNFKCPKTKSSTHCLTVLFLIYQNNNWTINGGTYNHTIFTSSHRIILKIWRATSFPNFQQSQWSVDWLYHACFRGGKYILWYYCNLWVAMEKAWVWAFYLKSKNAPSKFFSSNFE